MSVGRSAQKLKKQRSAAPLLPDTSSSTHVTQAALVLQHELLVANDVLVAEDTANAAAVGGESGELARVALLFGTVESRERFDDSAGIAGGDSIGWDVLNVESVGK